MKETTGEDISKEDLGGPKVAIASGVVHNLADDDAAGLDEVRRYLGYFPASAWSYPPSVTASDATAPRSTPGLLDIVPRDNRRAYDMRAVLDVVFDRPDWFEVQPRFGRAIVLPGSRSERSGILRSGARMFAAQTMTTTVKIHLTLRKAYGFGSMVMSLLGFDDQVATFGYPGATMGAMSAAALTRASKADDDVGGFDDLIDPRETRDALLAALHRGLSSRQAAAEPVTRTAILP